MKWIKNVSLVFGIVFLVLYCSTPLRSFDLGYHLATGKWILHSISSTGGFQIPQADPFSLTNPTGIWPLHQWIPATLIYGVYHFFGMLGLIFLRGMLVLGSGLILLKTLDRLDVSRVCSILFCILAILLLHERILLRPFWFSILLFLWVQYELVQWRIHRSIGSSLWLGFIFTLWVQLHAGPLFGLILVLLWTVGISWETRKVIWSPCGMALIGYILGLLIVYSYNPGGFAGQIQPFLFSSNDFYQGHIAEFKALDLEHFFPYYLFQSIILFQCIVFERKKTPGFFALALPWLFFFAASLWISRIYVYAIFTGVVFGCFLWKPSGENDSVKLGRPLILSGSLITLIVILNIGSIYLKILGETADRKVLPITFFESSLSQQVEGPIFNEDSWGGWLAFNFYPQSQIFVDNRLPVYGSNFYQHTYLPMLQGDLVKDFESLQFQWAILKNEPFESNSLQANLLRREDWKLVWVDDTSLVWRVRSENEKGFRLDYPAFSGRDFSPQAELFWNDMNQVNSSAFVRNFLGVFAARNGKNEEATLRFKEAIQIDPCFSSAWKNLANLEKHRFPWFELQVCDREFSKVIWMERYRRQREQGLKLRPKRLKRMVGRST